jgi:hypothetical protein
MRIQAEADGILNPSTVWKIEGIRPTNWPKRPLQPELVHCFEKSEARRLPGKQEKDIEGITATEIAKRLINALDMNDGTARSRVSRASDVELPRLATEGDIRYARGEALIWIDKQKPARTRDNDADY